MKTLKLIISLWCILFTGIAQQAYAVAETENNNTWNAAPVINLASGTSGTGTCAAGGDIDWWKVTLPSDGALNIHLAPTLQVYMSCELYDTLGNIVLAGNVTYVPFDISRVDLAKGTYYIKIRMNTSSETDAYTVTPTFTAAPVANDVEPNGTRATANTLALNDSTTGHCGYYFNNTRDTVDWFKVTTNKDGQLNITLTPLVQSYIHCELYDNNGTTLLVQNVTYVPFTISRNDLAVGTYYIKIYMNSSNEYSPYKLKNNLVLPPVVNDVEPNDTKATALTLNLNDSMVGHVGYYYNLKRDTADWYKVTTVVDGELDITLTPYVQSYIYCELYDNDGTTLLTSNVTYVPFTISRNDLAAGTYYIKIRMTTSNEYTPYKLKSNFVLPPVVNDAEPNDTKATAITLNPTDSIVGHCGYYYNLKRDTTDWRKITLTADGSLSLTLYPYLQSYIYLYLYDNDGVSVLAANVTYVPFTISRADLKAGTYYVRIIMNSSNEYTPYALKSTFTATPNVDPEPNDTKATAKALTLNTTKGGHLGYYYNHSRDTTDWYSITTKADGVLSITLSPVSQKYMYCVLYDNNGTTLLAGNVTYVPFTITRNDLGKGTYYLKVYMNNSGEFNDYTIIANSVIAGTVDVEPNNFAAKAVLDGGYVTKSGSVGYYYKLATDGADWYKFDYHAVVSTLNVVLTKKVHTFDGNYPDLLYRLYKDTTAAPIDSVQLTGASPLTYNHTYTTLTTATYYLRITPLNNTYGAYTLKGTYRDTASQTITNVLNSPDSVCGNGKLSYLVKQGLTPYSVQLFKDNVALGAPVSTNDTAKFTGLAPGIYFARAKSAGAATYFKASTTLTVIPVPKGTSATAITGHTATINWSSAPCNDGFLVGYKKSTVSTYTTDSVAAGATSRMLSGLTLSTAYNYRVAAFHRVGSKVYVSAYSAVKNFTTTAGPRMGDDENAVTENNLLNVYPNPSSGVFIVDLSNIKFTNATINVSDLQGRIISTEIANNENEMTHTVDLSSFENGVYIMTINSESGTKSVRLIKE